MHQTESLADDAGASEQRLNLFRRGIGGHVEILGLDACNQVADGPTHDIGFEAVVLENLADLDGMARYMTPIDLVLRGRDAQRFARSEKTVDYFLEHFC